MRNTRKRQTTFEAVTHPTENKKASTAAMAMIAMRNVVYVVSSQFGPCSGLPHHFVAAVSTKSISVRYKSSMLMASRRALVVTQQRPMEGETKTSKRNNDGYQQFQ